MRGGNDVSLRKKYLTSRRSKISLHVASPVDKDTRV